MARCTLRTRRCGLNLLTFNPLNTSCLELRNASLGVLGAGLPQQQGRRAAFWEDGRTLFGHQCTTRTTRVYNFLMQNRPSCELEIDHNIHASQWLNHSSTHPSFHLAERAELRAGD